MSTVTLGIDDREASSSRFVAAMKGESQGAYITFASADLLFQTLTQRRWNILRSMTGAGPLSVQEIARRTGHAARTAQRDVKALLNVGVLERNDDGTIEFPYDAVHVDFMLNANWFPSPTNQRDAHPAATSSSTSPGPGR
jgi:predicted transcriptional regulator